jgi:hypothetical protein
MGRRRSWFFTFGGRLVLIVRHLLVGVRRGLFQQLAIWLPGKGCKLVRLRFNGNQIARMKLALNCVHDGTLPTSWSAGQGRAQRRKHKGAAGEDCAPMLLTLITCADAEPPQFPEPKG